MNNRVPLYCLDSNVLIRAWNTYYSPKFCPDYWKILNSLGKQGTIFIPEAVSDEILKTTDELSGWLKKSHISVRKITEEVTKCLGEIYSKDPIHERLTDSVRYRSIADPWVIAHALNEKAVVVTNEEKITAMGTKKVKIPNVCENMGIGCISDFEFIHQVKIKFTCQIQAK